MLWHDAGERRGIGGMNGSGQMIMLVVTFSVEEQHRAAFETGLGDFARWSLANEPGTLFYQLGQDETDPSTYRLIELYADQASLDRHSTSDAYRQVGKAVGPLLAAAPTIVRHAPVNDSLSEKV
jgi:quinol monooxygenase YgiN